jgi:hypothetical protein
MDKANMRLPNRPGEDEPLLAVRRQGDGMVGRRQLNMATQQRVSSLDNPRLGLTLTNLHAYSVCVRMRGWLGEAG